MHKIWKNTVYARVFSPLWWQKLRSSTCKIGLHLKKYKSDTFELNRSFNKRRFWYVVKTNAKIIPVLSKESTLGKLELYWFSLIKQKRLWRWTICFSNVFSFHKIVLYFLWKISWNHVWFHLITLECQGRWRVRKVGKFGDPVR